MVGWGSWSVQPPGAGANPLVVAVPVLAAVAAGLALRWPARRQVLVLAAVALLGGWSALQLPALWHAIVPSELAAPAVRAGLAVVAGLVAAAAFLGVRPRRPADPRPAYLAAVAWRSSTTKVTGEVDTLRADSDARRPPRRDPGGRRCRPYGTAATPTARPRRRPRPWPTRSWARRRRPGRGRPATRPPRGRAGEEDLVAEEHVGRPGCAADAEPDRPVVAAADAGAVGGAVGLSAGEQGEHLAEAAGHRLVGGERDAGVDVPARGGAEHRLPRRAGRHRHPPRAAAHREAAGRAAERPGATDLGRAPLARGRAGEGVGGHRVDEARIERLPLRRAHLGRRQPGGGGRSAMASATAPSEGLGDPSARTSPA